MLPLTDETHWALTSTDAMHYAYITSGGLENRSLIFFPSLRATVVLS
jgi:hypothetical protein